MNRAWIAVAVLAAPWAAAMGQTERRFEFESARGDRHVAILSVPEPAARNGVSVLLIGGGAAWDQDWTVPGTITDQGHEVPVTIDARPTRDAATIAAALAERGFIVMRWSAIPGDDPTARAQAATAPGLTFAESVTLTADALKALRSQPGVEPGRIALVGHSLGATRACRVADKGVVAVAALGGAYLSRTTDPPRRIIGRVMSEFPGLDADGSGAIDQAELEAWTRGTGPPLPGIVRDRDDDGLVRGWELASAVTIERAAPADRGTTPDRDQLSGGPWPIDLIADSGTPVLAIYGGIDDLSFHGPWLERLARPGIEVRYIPGVGHQMGPESEGRFGPVSPDVMRLLAGWLSETTTPVLMDQPGAGR